VIMVSNEARARKRSTRANIACEYPFTPQSRL
jgi:hypothetical protein